MNLVTEHRTSENAILTAELWDVVPSAKALLRLITPTDADQNHQRATNNDRQLRLFAAWCARRRGNLLTDARSREAIRAAELFANDSISFKEMCYAHERSCLAVREIDFHVKNDETEIDATDHPTLAPEDSKPVVLNPRRFRGGAYLYAAYTACHSAAYTLHPLGGLHAAIKSAFASRKALYWDLLAEGCDKILITEQLESEEGRQAEALRTFIGNPFNPDRMPPLSLRTVATTVKS